MNIDQALRERAAKEDCPAPEGFDSWVEAMLDELPEKRRGRGWAAPLRTALLTAALCVLCTLSALALSPTLRDALAQAVGGFAPYMQEIDGAVCVENGVEVRVVSAVADSYMTKVYVEIRDLEGERLDSDTLPSAMIDRFDQAALESTDAKVQASAGGAKCIGFDEETGTLLVEVYSRDAFFSGRENMKLRIFRLYSQSSPGKTIVDGESWIVDLNVTLLDSRNVTLSGAVDKAQLTEAEISPLGVMLVTRGRAPLGSNYVYSVYLEDGTVVHPQQHGGFGLGEDGPNYTYLEFDEPVDPEQVTGIAIHYWMIPIDGDTAGEGYWLTELPEYSEQS